MTHDYHEGLPGYDARQILHDGCGECEARGNDPVMGIGSLDRARFAAAWRRAYEWNATASQLNISTAEAPVLRILWAVQVKLESVTGLPVGTLP